MREPRLASGFWLSAKIRLINASGGFASIMAKGHDEAGSINLILRARDGSLRLAVPAMHINGAGRKFDWHNKSMTEAELVIHMDRELRFDKDQWFVECECDEALFTDIFDIKSES